MHKHNRRSPRFIISLSVCLFSVSSTDRICHSATALSDLPFLEVLCSSLPLKGLAGSGNALESLGIFNAIDLRRTSVYRLAEPHKDPPYCVIAREAMEDCVNRAGCFI